ncbi:MAG: hypothetical protein DLM60_01000 [Pseudonocardiales bacterium]|nr:HNH endonuclease [Actinomycetota bacterium]PZS24127.1 MAG: hypothetical protein DLM60_01000 [Pseudonocardiales bacterium]
MTVRQLLPEGLAEMAPGPHLDAALAGLDLRALAGSDLVEMLQARARQLAHEQAQLLAVMAEIGWCDPNAEPDEAARLAQLPREDEPLVSASDEIRAALAWTRNAAYREYHFAQSLLGRLPAVFTALDTGQICRSKAWLFTELCAELTEAQAQTVAERLLPHAGRLTTGELAARIKKLAMALDPEWAARRYAAAVRDRDVIGYLDEDGTATVTGRRLPAEQAAAACARIEDLAKAAKRAGHPGRIGPLRADIYIGLLDGRWTRHSRDEIITDLLTQATPPDQPTPGQPTPDDSLVGEGASANGAPTTNDDPKAGDAPEAGSDPGAARAASGDAATDAAAETDTLAEDAATAGKAGESARSCALDDRVGVELRVGLSTLLGRDRHPGEIPGWGTVTAETAFALAAAQHRAEWRYAITDSEGRLILGGITRRRPSAPAGDSGIGVRRPSTDREPIQGGIVELHIPATLLTQLAAHPETCGPWTAVVGDIATQYRTSTTDAPDDAGGTGKQDPFARFAGAVLRRHVQIRDRTCGYPGCRCSARHADLDHTLDHGRGGVTTEANSGPLCRHDHLLKHEGGWRLRQPEPGHFVWTSPLGRVYHTRPQPITTDLPDPLPRSEYLDAQPPTTHDEHEPIFYRPPPRPDPPPASVPTPPGDPDEPAPF